LSVVFLIQNDVYTRIISDLIKQCLCDQIVSAHATLFLGSDHIRRCGLRRKLSEWPRLCMEISKLELMLMLPISVAFSRVQQLREFFGMALRCIDYLRSSKMTPQLRSTARIVLTADECIISAPVCALVLVASGDLPKILPSLLNSSFYPAIT